MSQAQKIREHLSKLKPQEGLDHIPLDLNEVAKAVHSTREKVGSQIAAMANNGRLEVVHDPNPRPGGGRRPIIGFRNLDLKGKAKANPVKMPRTVVVEEAKPARRLVQTPELDRLGEARSAMQEFARQFPGLVDSARAAEAIRIDPDKIESYVEEGLSVIERNEHLERTNRELRARNAELERELGYKRLRSDRQLREGLASAGVTHGD